MKPSEIRQLQIDTKYIIIGSILQKHGTVIKRQRALKCTCSKVLLLYLLHQWKFIDYISQARHETS